MAIKSSRVSYLIGLVKGLSEHAPAMVEGESATGGPTALVYPAAVVAAALGEGVADYTKDRKKPEDLAELYRESMLHAIEACTKDFAGMTDEDRSIVELWEWGLGVRVKGDPLWQTLLEESIPRRCSVST